MIWEVANILFFLGLQHLAGQGFCNQRCYWLHPRFARTREETPGWYKGAWIQKIGEKSYSWHWGWATGLVKIQENKIWPSLWSLAGQKYLSYSSSWSKWRSLPWKINKLDHFPPLEHLLKFELNSSCTLHGLPMDLLLNKLMALEKFLKSIPHPCNIPLIATQMICKL